MVKTARKSSERKKEWLAVLLKALSRSVTLLSFAIGFWLLMKGQALTLSEGLMDLMETVSTVLYSAAIGYSIYTMVDVIDHFLIRWAGRTESKVDDMLVPLVGKSIRITVFLLIFLQVVQSVSGKPITTIIAGLGVGGLAVALAGQDTIKNFFGSLVIVGDKPFEIGDRIIVDGHDGPVESVGFRSTKIRTLVGHLVTIPNAEMVNKTVQNIGKRPYIRRLMNITVTYDTSPEKIDRALEILKELLENHEGMNDEFPPKVYFNDFNDWSLNIIVLYWYHPPDYWAYMDFSEKLNKSILKRFNDEGIEFAFPSQTVYLDKGEKA
jgi:MscS family membrane protein